MTNFPPERWQQVGSQEFKRERTWIYELKKENLSIGGCYLCDRNEWLCRLCTKPE